MYWTIRCSSGAYFCWWSTIRHLWRLIIQFKAVYGGQFSWFEKFRLTVSIQSRYVDGTREGLIYLQLN